MIIVGKLGEVRAPRKKDYELTGQRTGQSKIFILIGACLVATASGLLTLVEPNTPIAQVIGFEVIAGVGFGMILNISAFSLSLSPPRCGGAEESDCTSAGGLHPGTAPCIPRYERHECPSNPTYHGGELSVVLGVRGAYCSHVDGYEYLREHRESLSCPLKRRRC